ncbi:hypothetical protein RJ640_004296 [Escallonia rubra]|uniref:Seipin n=1 Tax=Escallonia rubra TaxID=112253 RepID=A0AA88RVK2_9ASTE|nr:hypothetical protein RJ640_004296 [Escallonia rubra]
MEINENAESSHEELPSFDCKNDVRPPNFFVNLMKFSLLLGADKVLMARKLLRASAFDSEPSNLCREKDPEEAKRKVRVKPKNRLVKLSSNQAEGMNDRHDEYINISKVANQVSGDYAEFPSNIVAILAILLLKLVGFQISLLVRLFTLPLWLSYFSLMLLMFPLQTVSRIRRHLTKKVMEMWLGVFMSVTSFVCNPFKAQKSIVNLGVRIGWGLFWAAYVWFLLVGLLVSGFVISALTMRSVLEEPIQTTETLNFDYTRPSPVAFVPFMSTSGAASSSGMMTKDNANAADHVGARIIPYNHKLQLTVALTLPESEYNRKLGVFQVRVEFLSAAGKVTASSSYPSMLRFKSEPVWAVETVLKGVPLIAGFQSEVQILEVKISDFTEGYEPTACLRVILEQRAGYQPGGGIPEIYAGSVAIESELPKLKRIIWSWRRTVFVWLAIVSFLMELLVTLIFCRPILLPKARPRTGDAKKQAHKNKISW